MATNVAETSITIDDVTCVIDAGRVKELGYDAERGIARLQVSVRHADVSAWEHHLASAAGCCSSAITFVTSKAGVSLVFALTVEASYRGPI